jgi:DNA modification methylase
MAKIDITKTELVWPGKYDENGQLVEVPRVNLPFQIIETIGQSRATREADKKEREDMPLLYDVFHKKEGETFEEGWKNKLIWGDNLLVMGSLLEQFAGKIDLIYIDPPFEVGADFSFTTLVGDGDVELSKDQSLIEEKAYRDTWGQGTQSYLSMIYPRLILARDLLAENGSIYLHCDWRLQAQLRTVLDEILGTDCFRNEIIWKKNSLGAKGRATQFPRNQDVILFYTRASNGYAFERQYKEIMEPIIRDRNGKEKYPFNAKRDSQGRYYWTSPPGDYTAESIARLKSEGRIEHTSSGSVRVKYWLKRDGDFLINTRIVDDVWDDIEMVFRSSDPRTGFDTQKPEGLLERVINASSIPEGLVADLFCGSGTTLAVAEKLGRRWIGCDLGRWAIHVSRKRLLGIENCKPFEVLNLGKYERQYWQGVTFKKEKKEGRQLAIFEYLKFVLKLYGAEPLAGMEHLHGKKGGAVIHVGAVDAPVTIDEINACLDECKAIKQKELHILGWEWEMGLYEIITEAAKGRGIKLLLLQIPREVMEQQAVQKGDVRFFELAYLEVKIKSEKGRKVAVELKDFVIPNTELIPQEVRDKVKKWSDFIDYWAIDWDFRNDTFMQGWVDYRTRKNRSLSLKSDPHTYGKPGKYTIMVKVVDIFGNDTSQLFETEVK